MSENDLPLYLKIKTYSNQLQRYPYVSMRNGHDLYIHRGCYARQLSREMYKCQICNDNPKNSHTYSSGVYF